MADTPADDVKDVHDEPDKGDTESLEETRERHEMLHHEHRSRIDKLMEHCGIKEEHGEGEPQDDARGVRDRPDRSDSIRARRRHD